ncbi:DNA-binding transcriptional regulator [uncultured Bacteroides sp.]|uniref:DNA-binding transcriptional regulator n=1 Tax=uncultured Bacteroides sp. TaxID=162156 RepID=UPI002AAB664F|nr:DNA-binding transcriptional regulator [uncultured Bacteroides sp.]
MIRLILLTDFTESYAHNLLKGIMTYSKENEPWVLCRMPLAFKQQYGIEGILNWAKRWKADAIIAQFDNVDNVDLFRQNGIVALAQDYKSRFSTIPNITSNYKLTGKMVADFFLQRGFKNFAFFGYKNACWSQERCEGFKDEVTKFGFKNNFYAFHNQKLEELWFYKQHPLSKWLKSLPKPIALMACDDTQGQIITEICKLSNLRIPEDIAVMGVDNDEMTCNLSDPSLSSVLLDIEKGGYDSARLIDSMIRSKNLSTYNDIYINTSYIVQRQSTNIYPIEDKEIAQALKYIDQCTLEKISVDDIVKQVPLSRRLLEIRFKQYTKMSIYQYIMKKRMGRFAQMLIESNAPVTEIAAQIGITDIKNLSRQFKTIEGCSPLEYRKEHTLKK